MVERVRLMRVTGATLGLVVGGALAGSAVGIGWLGALALAVDGLGGFPYVWDAFGVAGAVGALFGAIGLPVVTWSFLRHVSFARVVAYSALGTMVGATIGALATHLSPLPAIACAVAGFVSATLWLRIRTPRP
jgi:hypothetical protein